MSLSEEIDRVNRANIERALKHTSHHFRCFSRNGRWGTCGGCPRTSDGEVFPEFCEFTERYDHQLLLDDLCALFGHHRVRP